MAVLKSPQFAAISPRAAKALLCIASQYRGNNNGDLSAAFRLMQPLGWTSKDQLSKAVAELIEAGFLILTRQGGNRIASLYALTFKSVDWSDKYDDGIQATAAAPNTWKQRDPKKLRDRAAGRCQPVARGKKAHADSPLPRATGQKPQLSTGDSPRSTVPFLSYQGQRLERGTANA
jgi:hypothetical protein